MTDESHLIEPLRSAMLEKYYSYIAQKNLISSSNIHPFNDTIYYFFLLRKLKKFSKI